jgi:hypothetical protein
MGIKNIINIINGLYKSYLEKDWFKNTFFCCSWRYL